MNRFGYARAATVEDALALLAAPGAQIIAGGADLVPLLADDLAAPALLVDITRIPDLDRIAYDPADGLWLGALAQLNAVMKHPVVQAHYAVLAQAIAESASPQVRNLATIGGNLLQQPRCPYFRDVAFACLKRDGGDLCSAIGGDTSHHALFGYGIPDPQATCVAVHPSDAVNALATMDASVVLRSGRGERRVPIMGFFVAPKDDPRRNTVITPDEIIVGIAAPMPPENARGTYCKIRDRAAYEFAIVSAAAVIAEQDGVVTHARLALGGLAWGPYHPIAAEAALIGQPLTAENAAEAARIALDGAQPLSDNAYKIPMAQAALRRAILGGG
jgi:xanthine dehydrogenase YagS FAD-binding subunit